MKRNIVIGSEGFIGKPFCRFLEEKGEEVVRFDIVRNKKEDARKASLPLKNIDCVYFLAWEVGGAKYLYQENTQLTQLHWNLELLDNVMRQFEKHKPNFVFVSSQLSEENTIYGATKRLGELWTEQIGGTTVRVWNADGIMEKHDVKSHVISDFIHQAITNKKIKMLTDGTEWRQFTHISDLSRAFYMAGNTKNLSRSVFDASSYHWVQVKEIADMIAKKTDAKVISGKVKGSSPNATNQGRIPGWLPEVTLEEGIKKMVLESKHLY